MTPEDADLQLILGAAREAGALAASMRAAGLTIEYKAGNSRSPTPTWPPTPC
jgi:hypothetical protein